MSLTLVGKQHFVRIIVIISVLLNFIITSTVSIVTFIPSWPGPIFVAIQLMLGSNPFFYDWSVFFIYISLVSGTVNKCFIWVWFLGSVWFLGNVSHFGSWPFVTGSYTLKHTHTPHACTHAHTHTCTHACTHERTNTHTHLILLPVTIVLPAYLQLSRPVWVYSQHEFTLLSAWEGKVNGMSRQHALQLRF